MLQQRITGFYNAQCCGVAFEYQTYNYGGVSSFVVPSDHRFFLSFTPRRPRQLLAVQRRDERRAALAGDCMSARRSSPAPPGSPAAISSICSPRRRRHRRVAPAGRHARRATARHRVDGRPSICSTPRRCSAPIAELRPAAVYHCAGAAHVGRSWDDTASDVRDQRPRHASPARRRCERARRSARVLIPSSALVYASADEALHRRRSARADQPVRRSASSRRRCSARVRSATVCT